MGETRVLNKELLRETLEYIKTHPQNWSQSVWFAWTDDATGHPEIIEAVIDVEEVNSCGSAFCFAGHAALKSGFPPPPKYNFASWLDPETGIAVDEHARRVLGLTAYQANMLFDAVNSLEDLEVMVNALIDDPDIDDYALGKLVGRHAIRPYDDDDYY